MDNLCHTLAGLALGEAGLKRRTALGNVTLVIGANLPDLDALSYAWGPVTALGFRRGWTHGILAMGVWPLVLAGLMLAWDRSVRLRRRPDAEPARPRALLLLAALAVWSHPLLDLLNTYGVRLLMPFSGHWSYGDTLFIVDPWVWAALGIGILVSRWRWGRRVDGPVTDGPTDRWAARPARLALAGVLLYIGVMAASATRMREAVLAGMRAHEPAPTRVMVAPMPLNPFRRQVVVELPAAYATGVLRLPSGRFDGPWMQIPRQGGLPASREAAATALGRTYLSWARFPFFAAGDDCAEGMVCIRDARYFPMSWAEVAVSVGGAISLAPSPPSGTVP